MRTVVVNPHASTGWLGRSLAALAAAALVGMASDLASAADADEFKVKRQNVFEFTAKPTVKHDGDKVTITFTSKAFCDATVAIEDGQGDGPSTGSGQGQPGIVRHLASGVLGPNAPAPFQKDSLSQTLVWDSKDDQGVYVRDASRCSVRVSLGLKPQFERTLFWSPHKRVSESSPLVKAATEGIYVVDGQVCDHVRLFDHQGRYVRTIYPFPADKVASVLGVTWHDFVQAGTKAPLKVGYHQGTLLTGGTNNNPRSHEEGRAAFAFAVRGDRIALTMLKLNRLATDGATGGRQLEGPPTSLPADMARYSGDRGNPLYLTPWSVEFSPDGKRLYLAGYAWTFWEVAKWDCLSGVFQMDYEGSDPPKLFAGTNKPYAFGAGDGDFHCATSVACDTAGRVYVSDYMNDRIQVLDASGKLLKSVPVNKPAVVRVHQKTGEMYVFSWPIHNVELSKNLPNSDRCYWSKVTPTLTRLGPLDDPRPLGSYPLPLPIYGNWWAKHPPGPMYGGEIDSWSEQTTIWISTVRGRATERGMGGGGDGFGDYGTWDKAGIKAFTIQDGKLTPFIDFGKEAATAAGRAAPPIIGRQRLYVNPKTGKLYVAEGDCGVMKAFNQLVEINPESGKTRLVDLPLGAEDMAFDLDGQLYLRTDTVVARYDPTNWREIPFDYGEERENHSYGMGAKSANLISGLATPGHRSFNFWHLGGISISPAGHIAVTTCNGAGMSGVSGGGLATGLRNTGAARKDKYEGRPYTPQVYPGRMRWGEIHIWDRHGKALVQDAVPGMGHLNGIGIDRDDNIYMLAASRRLIDGKPIDPALGRDASGTVVKVAAGKAKVLSAGGAAAIPVPLPDSARPNKPIEMTGYTTGWVNGAQWLYGGVGFCTPGACVCWNSRFNIDYFGRSFAPEPLCYTVAVLDPSGNVVCRIGRYGNVDDGKALVSEPLAGEPAGPPARPLGGDEVALVYACYVATDTDHRLFIADLGNERIVSVKLNYHATERVPLR